MSFAYPGITHCAHCGMPLSMNETYYCNSCSERTSSKSSTEEKISLSDRMKNYEQSSSTCLIRKKPVIIRLDGKAFHTFTQGLEKPFDYVLSRAFEYTCFKLKEKVQGTKFIYSQSDEINLLLTDWDKACTNSWFEYRLQKIVSVSCSLATNFFNQYIYNYINLIVTSEKLKEIWTSKLFKASFDSRAFNLEKDEVCNYFIWRQKDAIRNSKQAFGQSVFSHKELQNKKCDKIIEMCKETIGVDWNDFSNTQKMGFCVYKNLEEDSDTKWIVDNNIPSFIENREYIERYLEGDCESNGK